VAKEIVVINDAGDTVASFKYDQEKENCEFGDV